MKASVSNDGYKHPLREWWMRVLWTLTTSKWDTQGARLRAFWNVAVCRWETELCGYCGGRVMPRTGSWWSAPDALWARVIGDPTKVVCPPCFTAKAQSLRIWVRWEAAEDDLGELTFV